MYKQEIESYIARHCMTVEEFAKSIKLTKQTIYNVMKDNCKNPRTLNRIKAKVESDGDKA